MIPTLHLTIFAAHKIPYMKLQKLVKNKILARYSKKDFIQNLKLLKLQGSQQQENYLYENMIMYYSLFFNMDIDYQNDVIKYRDLHQKIKFILIDKLNNDYQCNKEFTTFLIEIIDFGCDYVYAVRKLVS